MRNKIDNLLYDIRNFLINDNELEDMHIEYLIINNKDITDSVAYVCNNEQGVFIKLKDWEKIYEYDWSYDIDDSFFSYLQEDYSIGYIDLEWHYNVWCTIEDIGVEEIESKLGLQIYLKYCKENGIDKEYLESKFNRKVFDIMQYYDDKTEYIQIKDEQVTMPKEMYQKENEVNYITFCLGYDVLNHTFNNSEVQECDQVYDFCDYLARKFIETDYYKNERRSTYEMLQEWVNDNKDIIQSEYLYFAGVDNKKIIETGKRNDTPIALVEHYFKDGTKEYIVAFNYEINNKKVNWGYGYYYSNNLEKAKKDFEKVKAGGNLADTFKEKNKLKFKERGR